MKAQVVVDAGICGFQSRIRADSEDSQTVVFQIASDCGKVKRYAEALNEKGPVDAYAEIGAGTSGVVLATADARPTACCLGCAVPVGLLKAMQVAAGLALPKDVTLTITSE